jgi:multimeric flavodoxin WrbA
MKENLLAIIGSPRRESNSTTLMETFVQQVRQDEPESAVVVKRLQEMTVKACTGCDMCKRIGQGCVLKDDMNVLYPLVKGADTLVLSSPVYWWGISAQLKIFIDRLYALEKNDLAGKRLFLFVTGSDGLEGIQYQLIKQQFQEICTYTGIDFAGYLPISADDENPVKNNPTALSLAISVAKKR